MIQTSQLRAAPLTHILLRQVALSNNLLLPSSLTAILLPLVCGTV
ncbi:MAG: hypothetical protein ACRD8W_29825 [Nitrososphaeraceae archaeon]